jgi:SAM-dependent methyltransferase
MPFDSTCLLACPLDKGALAIDDAGATCTECGVLFPLSQIGDISQIDFRAQEINKTHSIKFELPVRPISPADTLSFGRATDAKFKSISRQKLRRLYGSKLQKEILFYCTSLVESIGPEIAILDLGCGSGGNTEYLKSLGAKNIVKVDFLSESSDYQVDVHRMPFLDQVFDLVITTSTIEHFYNPFIAFQEISRVLKSPGTLIASGSFWESWHGNSCFHFTPGGLTILCESANLSVHDMWSGWGFIPSIFSHTTGFHFFKPVMYPVQKIFDYLLRLAKGREFALIHKFRTSGSFGLFAKKLPKKTSSNDL